MRWAWRLRSKQCTGPGRALGSDVILGNTYHLMLRPGAERVARLGGLHEFALALSDPHRQRRFQVMSLATRRSAKGVTFRSHIDGAAMKCRRSARSEIQGLLDSTFRCNSTNAPHCRRAAGHRARDDFRLRWAERWERRSANSRTGDVRRRPGRRQCGGCVRSGSRSHGPEGLRVGGWRSASHRGDA